MIKAMVEHLATANTLHAPRKHRFVIINILIILKFLRFSEQFNDDILNMVASLTGEIISKHAKQPAKIVQLNACLGFFLHDLLSVMDRGYVFNLIRTYMKDLTAKVHSQHEGQEEGQGAALWGLQIDFLR
jgi:hypothetical protein